MELPIDRFWSPVTQSSFRTSSSFKTKHNQKSIRIDYGLLIVCLIVANILSGCLLVSGETYTSAEYEERLGVAYEFKIHVDAGREECFYQNVQPGSSLFVAFQVMRGGDQKAAFAVRDPQNNILLPYEWKESAELELAAVQNGGYYQLCIDNSVSHFAAKLVSMYVAAFKRDEWEKYIEELGTADVQVSNFTSSLKNVDDNIGSMLRFLDGSRRALSHDWYLVDGNNRYVMYWSLAQCIVVIVSGVVQVIFYRKMFDNSKVYGSKPRA